MEKIIVPVNLESFFEQLKLEKPLKYIEEIDTKSNNYFLKDDNNNNFKIENNVITKINGENEIIFLNKELKQKHGNNFFQRNILIAKNILKVQFGIVMTNNLKKMKEISDFIIQKYKESNFFILNEGSIVDLLYFNNTLSISINDTMVYSTLEPIEYIKNKLITEPFIFIYFKENNGSISIIN